MPSSTTFPTVDGVLAAAVADCGIQAVADRLHVDVPAVDRWIHDGVPEHARPIVDRLAA